MPSERRDYSATRATTGGRKPEPRYRPKHRAPRKNRLSLILFVALMIGLGVGFCAGLFVGRRQAASASGSGYAVSAAAEQTALSVTDGPDTAAKPAGDIAHALPAVQTTPESAKAVGANEMGLVLILEYHRISTDGTSDDLHRTYQEFRQDIETLKAEGYYPITAREFASGRFDVPAGKSPVILTFDDSSPGQYRILEDGSLDPDCAVGIMQAAVRAGNWAPKALFSPLLYVYPEKDIIFGQPEHAQAKLQQLVAWGYEIGSHTRTHADLRTLSREQIAKELAESQTELEELIGSGYKVTTLAVPYGYYPTDVSILAEGEYQGTPYKFSAALDAAGGPTPSPFSDRFDPYRIKRVPVVKGNLAVYLKDFRDNPGIRFVSDGDPDTISYPATLASVLGQPRNDLELRVVTYEP